MKRAAANLLRTILLCYILLPAAGLLQAQTGGEEPSPSEASTSSPLPDLASIIPLAGDLEGRLAVLEVALKQLPDVTPVKTDYDAFKAEVDNFEAQLQRVKDSERRRWSQLMGLSQQLQEARLRFDQIENPLSRKINQLASWKAEWLAEKNNWLSWESRLLTEQDSPQLTAAFSAAGETIDAALTLITQQLNETFELQAGYKSVRTRLAVLDAETDSLVTVERRDYLLNASPSMYSLEYLAQFRANLWQTMLENIKTLAWPDRRYLVQHGWTFIAQIFLFIAIIFSIYRNREALRDSERWRFLAARPLATAFFIVILTQMLIPENQLTPLMVHLLFVIIGGISFARILIIVVEDSWQKRAILGLIALFVVSEVLTAISLPLPLLRLYILLASLLALYFLVRSAIGRSSQTDSALYTWGRRLGYILLGVIIIAQLRGNEGFASYLFNSTLKSLAIILAFCLFIYMIRGCLQWVFYSSPVWNIKRLRSEAGLLSRRTGYLVEALVVIFALLPILLKIWGVYGSTPAATQELLALGFSISSERITVGLLLTVIGILYGSLILSWILPKVILDEKIAGANLERGVRISIAHLIQYFIVLVGIILTLTALGLDFTKLTIILSALGVGIGFGLQGLVNNFFSGLVLLFERPVRVGDSIEIDTKWAEIRNIGLRATTVQTFDKADMIIPNAELISKVVTNWTLTNRQVRVHIQVGVAYGSDVTKVMETLLASAAEHDKVLKSPPPQVLFQSFGASSLDFELRVWIIDVDYTLLIKSELHQEIDRRFREANIEIAYPHLDLHLRRSDKPCPDRLAGCAASDEQAATGKD